MMTDKQLDVRDKRNMKKAVLAALKRQRDNFCKCCDQSQLNDCIHLVKGYKSVIETFEIRQTLSILGGDRETDCAPGFETVLILNGKPIGEYDGHLPY